MSKTESTIVGVFLAGTCALPAFVICWWTAAVAQTRLPGIPVSTVFVAARAGLLIGIIVDVLFRWADYGQNT